MALFNTILTIILDIMLYFIIIQLYMAQILTTIASLAFWGNKTFLLLGKKINKRVGWFLGAFAAILFIVYFFLIETYILSILEIGLTVLMTHRFIAKEKTNKGIEYGLGIFTGVIILILTIFTIQGLTTLLQFFGAFGMLVGTYFLISAKQGIETISLSERIGWLLYAFGHFFTSYIGYQKHEWIFFIFQAWQMLLCLSGFSTSDPRKRKVIVWVSIIGGGIASLIFAILINRVQ